MKDYVVWIDSKNARIFALNPEGIAKSIVTKAGPGNHTPNKSDKKTHEVENSEHYFRDLAHALKGADNFLLIGPGLAKNQFKHHLAEHQAETLAKKIIGLENFESSEHTTEKKMLAEAHKFFKNYELF
ncbi:MAG: hypothetical protein H7326_11675 [Bdellovibrionaceae bacterium]|nr:hypothetical protein [Pseudobdellovibrionaceae bacterium]